MKTWWPTLSRKRDITCSTDPPPSSTGTTWWPAACAWRPGRWRTRETGCASTCMSTTASPGWSSTTPPGFPILKDTDIGTAPHLHFLTLARKNNRREKKQEATRPPAFSCKPAVPPPLKILCPAGHQRAQKILWIFDCPYKTIYSPLHIVFIMLQRGPVGGPGLWSMNTPPCQNKNSWRLF